MNISMRKMIIPLCCVAFICCMTACGGDTEDKGLVTATDNAGNTAAAKEAEVTDENAESASAIAVQSAYVQTITAAEKELSEGESPYFGIMHVGVLDVNGNVGESSTVYSFKDKQDPENILSVTGMEIGDIEADMSEGNDVVVLFNGDIVNDAENVRFIAVLTDGEYKLREAEGTTSYNNMSVFTLETKDGSIQFLKDNCKIDENALKSDSGEKLKVYYADGGELGNFPLRIFSKQ